MSFTNAVRAGFHNWNVIDGRASRSEYWWWTLFLFLGSMGIVIVAGVLGSATRSAGGGAIAVISLLWLAAAVIVIVPSFTVSIRRLHDTGRSGWWLLLSLIPLGSLVILVFTCLDGNPGPNNWGNRPGGNMPGSRAAGTPLIGVADELQKLEALRASGAISDQEFTRQRERLLPE